MNWNAPLDESDLAAARPIAIGTEQIAHDLISYVKDHVSPTRQDGDGWTAPRLAALFIAAAWEASKSEDVRMPPDEYVGMLRAHADTIENMLL